ncbi:MAG: universal stress protein [Leifsonia sp.]
MNERVVGVDDNGRAAASRWAARYSGDDRSESVIVSRSPSGDIAGLVEGLPGIVVWVPPGWAPADGPIVAATGHDLASDAAIAPAIELARRGSGTVVLVHVWGMPALGIVDLPPDPWGVGSIPDGQSAALDALLTRVQAAADGVSISAVVRQGTHVARELIAASQGADAIVVGRPHPRGRGPALGAVARGLIELSPCPVVVIPHPAAMKDLRP